jgi:BASS family bile acid:Na+ symporter
MEQSVLTSVVLPISLGIIMLGMGLSLLPEDFQRVKKYPKAVSVGLICQIVLLPIIGFIIASVVPMQPAIATGLMIVTLCPGGVSSNIITFLAKGDVALSVTLTACSSVITVFTIPIFGNLAYQHFMGESAAIALPIDKTILKIVLMILVPIGLGMIIRLKFPQFALSLEKSTNRVAGGFLALIIILLIIREWESIPNYILQVGIGALALNIIAMSVGFVMSQLLKLDDQQKICITIEVGFQNNTLAFTIAVGILNNIQMGIPAAVYGLFMFMTGFLAICYGRKLNIQQSAISGQL